MEVEVKLFYSKIDLFLYDDYFWYEPLRPPPFVGRYERKDGRGSCTDSGRFLPDFIIIKK